MSTDEATRTEVYQDRRGQWRFRAKAANGRNIAQSEGYATRWSAKRGARRAFPRALLSS